MRARLRFKRFVPQERPAGLVLLLRGAAAAFVLMVLAVAMFQSHNANIVGATIPRTTTSADPLSTDLMRCRTVTPEQLAVDDTCRRAWAENRRRFFAPSSSRSDTAVRDPAAAPTTRGKAQDRLPAAGVQSDRDEVR
jgi:conjugative transfer region protein TrbK